MMNRGVLFLVFISGLLIVGCLNNKSNISEISIYTGSGSCIECHEKFYNLWSPSHHGKAMQPVTGSFIMEDSIFSSKNFELEGKKYQVISNDSILYMLEEEDGEILKYNISWALGGKNVFYFLTDIEKGKLQTIPLAFDVRKKIWYNNPESAVRHFPGGTPDEALPWKDRMYTFNTSCYSCHVSQLKTNYSLASDSYNTKWNEPGINCETCHGPSSEHVRIFRELKEGEKADDIGLIVTKTFTPEQHNSSCAPCHAKMQPITASYTPGDRYFDNYDLTTLENSDFYPDGRDLGENYTMTGWAMNECSINSGLHCVTCHTSSGRTRYTGEESNYLCLPCHDNYVDNVSDHSMHLVKSEGSLCVNCHMPKTEFGRMIRSDHSFRAPMPGATIKFESPNACNICHKEESPEWADSLVKRWYRNNYQEETLKWGQLIKEARDENWDNLDKILQIVENDVYGEVVTTSFIRLLANCPNDKKWEAIIEASKNKSPLVRAASAASLSGNFTELAKNVLVNACNDDFRLVRIFAAFSLVSFPIDQFSPVERGIVSKATEEYRQSLISRPDDWSAHYNMGIFYQNSGDVVNAIESYETSNRLYPEALMPLINSSVLFSYIGNPVKAEEKLRLAVNIDPENEAANLNLGLLLAEMGETEEAKKALKKALKTNPNQGVAAYNLSVLYAESNLDDAINYAALAVNAFPDDSKYIYTLAFFQNKAGKINDAKKTLNKAIQDNPDFLNLIFLLSEIYKQNDESKKAITLLNNYLKNENISNDQSAKVKQLILELKN